MTRPLAFRTRDALAGNARRLHPLNGLVTLASPASLAALRAARNRSLPTPQATEEFHRWLEEAIGQAESPP